VNSATTLIRFQVLFDYFPNETWCRFGVLFTHADSPIQDSSIQLTPFLLEYGQSIGSEEHFSSKESKDPKSSPRPTP